MVTSTTVNNWAAPTPNGSFPSVSAAVAAFTSHHTQLDRLTRIAQRRLDRLAIFPPGQRLRSREDPLGYVHEVICLVLAGQRPARTRHLQSPQAFFNFLQGVLQSCLSNALKSVAAEGEHLPIGPEEGPDSPEVDPPSPTDVAQEVALGEIKQQLRARLRQSFARNPDVLRQIDLWEETGADTLPAGDLSAKKQHRFKRRAQDILRTMSKREGMSQATGREFLKP
jgi:hypothetical protein